MRYLLKVFAAVMCLALIASAAESKELTLDDCIELALKNRASIIAARGKETLAKWNQRTALGAFLPRVEASYSYSKTKLTDVEPDVARWMPGDTIIDTLYIDGTDTLPYWYIDVLKETVPAADQDRSRKAFSLGAGMFIFDPSKWFNYAGAKAVRAKARLDVINSEQDLIYSVKASYYAYLATVENVAVQEQAVERSKEQLKLIESKFELGSASKSDVLKQKVLYGNDKLSLLTAQNAVTTTKADLAYTIGVDPGSNVGFSTDYSVREFQGTLPEAIDFGLDHEPGLLAAQKSVDSAKYAVRSRWSEYLPKLSASASIGWSDQTQGDTLTYDFSYRSATYGLQITYNIFDGFLRERNLSRAKVFRNTAMALLAERTNLVSRDIKTAYLDIERLKEQKKVAKENVDASEEDLNITQERYRLGAATILDLLDAQVSLKEAQVSLLRADFDLNLAVAKLENAMGKM